MKSKYTFKFPFSHSMVIAVAAFLCSGAVEAETDRVPADRSETGRLLGDASQTDFDMRAFRARLHNALELSEEQITQLRDLRAQLQVRLGDTREEVREGNLSRTERRAMVRRIMNAHRQSRDAILNPDQIALLDRAHDYLAERRLERRLDRPHRRHRFDRLADALELNPEQRHEWRALLERQRAAIHNLRESDEAPTRDDVRQLRLQHKEAFEAILTPEQLRLFRDIEDRRHRRGDAGDADEFPSTLDDDPATSVGTMSWGEIKEGSR